MKDSDLLKVLSKWHGLHHVSRFHPNEKPLSKTVIKEIKRIYIDSELNLNQMTIYMAFFFDIEYFSNYVNLFRENG